MNHELEVDLRVTGCEYIQTAGMLLQLPQVAMATAQVLFQRFYYAKSFVDFKVRVSIVTCTDRCYSSQITVTWCSLNIDFI